MERAQHVRPHASGTNVSFCGDRFDAFRPQHFGQANQGLSTRSLKHRTLPNVIGSGIPGGGDWPQSNLDTCHPRGIGSFTIPKRERSLTGDSLTNVTIFKRDRSATGESLCDDNASSVTARSRASQRHGPTKARGRRDSSRPRPLEDFETPTKSREHRDSSRAGPDEVETPIKVRESRESSRPRRDDVEQRKMRDPEFTGPTGEGQRNDLMFEKPGPSRSSSPICPQRKSSESPAIEQGGKWRSSSCTRNPTVYGRNNSVISTLEHALLPSLGDAQLQPKPSEQRAQSSTALRFRNPFARKPLMPYETLPTPPGRFQAPPPETWFPHPSACLHGAAPHDFQAIFVTNHY